MNIMKISVVLVLMAVLSVTAVTADIGIDYVRINGEQVLNNENLVVELGETLNIRVRVTAENSNESNVEYNDVEVMARLIGFNYRDREGNLVAIEGPFDMDSGDTRNIDLKLRVPITADKDEYELRIDVGDRRNDYDGMRVTLRIKDPNVGLLFRDVIMSPMGSVEAGRALLVQARVENLGRRDLRDIKITAEIPRLNVEGSTFLDERIRGTTVGQADIAVSEEILLRIPACAQPGVYDVVVTAEFDRYERETLTRSIQVVASDSCAAQMPAPQQPMQDRTVITPPQSQTINVGQGGASFPVVITNLGTAAKSYTVSVSGVNAWGVAEVNEPAPLVRAGESKIVYVFVSANPGVQAGQQVFSIAVNDQSFPVVANLVVPAQESSWDSIRRGLEIGLIVLVVLLIIVGLIVGFSRLRNDREEDDGKTYY